MSRRYWTGTQGVNRVNLYTRKNGRGIQVSWWVDGRRYQRALRTITGKPVVDWGLAERIADGMAESVAEGSGTDAASLPDNSRYVRGYVYVIRAASGAVKIGYSADPESRREALQTAHAESLHLVSTYPGTPEDEARLHRLADDHHLRREWFTEDVIQLVARYFDTPSPTPPAPEVGA